METLLQSRSLVQRALWLIRLRWVAIAGLAAATFVAGDFLSVSLPMRKLFVLTVGLGFYNFLLWDLFRYFTWGGRSPSAGTSSRLITFQISVDFLILTLILHFAGGIENPFFLYFVFHTILASVLLSRLQSYIQATLAVLLFATMVLLEYYGKIPHYPLEGFVTHTSYRDGLYVFGTLGIFTTTIYLVVYMTTSLSLQLQKQQNAFEAANIELNRKDHYKNEYVLRLTHDIKGHIAAIESCLDVVLSEMTGPLTEKQRDLAERANRRAAKCMAFIRALLRLTRMKLSGQLQMEDFSLRNAVFNAISAVERRASQKSIAVSYNIEKTVDIIYGEPVLIEETVTNMLYNAARYTPEKGRIELTVEDEGNSVLVKIRDTGMGIPPGEEKKIFEEFYRAANAREIEREGTGLGLSIVREVMERHGGSAWAKNNEPGPGSTFYLRLPKKSKSPKPF